MKLIALLFAAIFVCCAPQRSQANMPEVAASAYPPEYLELLKTYVTPKGVRYAAWHANKADVGRIKKVAEFFSSTAPPAERSASLAWHLNAYNAWILNNILAIYPTKGPMEGDGSFFDRAGIVISGKKTSFNDLEQKVIRPTFQDPHIHFALNCASRSCPPLQDKPFDPATLEGDLEHLARTFINTNPQGVVPDANGKRIHLSKIFDWYADDFGGKGNQITFINRYREHQILTGSKVDFMEYSWSLNEVP